MPPEQKRPIEELLEASARKRRAEFGAEPQMPNPMRARLHEEIARLNRADEPKPRRSWLAIFWPQLSIATAVAAVLLTTAVVWKRGQSSRESGDVKLAMSAPPAAAQDATSVLKDLETAPQVAMAAPAQPAAEAADAATRSADESSESDRREKEGGTALGKFADVELTPSDTPGSADPAAAEDKSREIADARVAARKDELAQQQATAAMARPSEKFASAAAPAAAPPASASTSSAQPNLQQRFSQTERGQQQRS